MCSMLSDLDLWVLYFVVHNMINNSPRYRVCGNEAEIIKGMT